MRVAAADRAYNQEGDEARLMLDRQPMASTVAGQRLRSVPVSGLLPRRPVGVGQGGIA